jgi:hypothetical protein
MIFIGVDPGRTGAIAAIDENKTILMLEDWPDLSTKKVIKKRNSEKKKTKTIHNIPGEIKEVCCIWEKFVFNYGKVEALIAIERQHAHSHRGNKEEKTTVGMTSTVVLMQTYTAWLTLFCCHGHIHLLPTSYNWQKEILGKKHREKMDTKAESLKVARQLFPSAQLNLKKHHGRADALLITEWLRRKHCD